MSNVPDTPCDPNAVDSLCFEEALGELEKVVAELEQKDMSLADMLKLFERGTLLAGVCGKLLNEAELQVTQLSSRESP